MARIKRQQTPNELAASCAANFYKYFRLGVVPETYVSGTMDPAARRMLIEADDETRRERLAIHAQLVALGPTPSIASVEEVASPSWTTVTCDVCDANAGPDEAFVTVGEGKCDCPECGSCLTTTICGACLRKALAQT